MHTNTKKKNVITGYFSKVNINTDDTISGDKNVIVSQSSESSTCQNEVCLYFIY